MKLFFHSHLQLGIAWIPVLLLAAVGSVVIIGGAVLYNDWSVAREANKYAEPSETKQALHEQLDAFFNQYRKSCFSQVASVGNRSVYHKALDEVTVAYNPNRKMTAFAQYQKGAIFLRNAYKDYDLSKENTKSEFQVTLWHELTHHLEVQNNDRLWSAFNPRRGQVAQRNERHTEYMEYTLGILRQFMRIEDKVKKKQLSAQQAKAQFAELQKQLATGSANEYETVPSDLPSLASYTGFQVDFNKIIDFYKKGTCIQFPDGTFDAAPSGDTGISEDSPDVYVVWEATNATVGIAITTKKQYETEEPASSYPGGGLDPNYIIEKKLLSGKQTFTTFDEAEKWICSQFFAVWYAPLGIGWTAKYGSKDTFLANTSCGCPDSKNKLCQ